MTCCETGFFKDDAVTNARFRFAGFQYILYVILQKPAHLQYVLYQCTAGIRPPHDVNIHLCWHVLHLTFQYA